MMHQPCSAWVNEAKLTYTSNLRPMTGRKKSKKSILVVHKAASPSLRRTKIAQQKHVGFGLKQNGIHVTTGYVASSSKLAPPPVPEDLVPITWMDAIAGSNKVLWESIMMSQDDSSPRSGREIENDDFNISIDQREAYLEEMMNHEGRGYNPPDQCSDCCDGLAIYQCRNCFGQDLLCQTCIVHRHTLLPFHRVRVSKD
jgi:hypothetical protein